MKNLHQRLLLAGVVALCLLVQPAGAQQMSVAMSPPAVPAVELPGRTNAAFFEDTLATVFHWKADDWNLVRGPEALGGGVASVWSAGNVALATTTAAGAPRSAPNAMVWSVTVDATNNPHRVLTTTAVPTAAGVVYSMSFFAKLSTSGAPWVGLVWGPATVTSFFDLSSGAISGTTPGATAAMTDEGNGWYRCSLTFSAAAPQVLRIHVASAPTAGAWQGTGTEQVFLTGVQVVRRSVPAPYVSSPVANLVAAPSDFNNATWIKQALGLGLAPVVTSDVARAPDGTMTADKVEFSAVPGGFHGSMMTSVTVTSPGGDRTYTAKVWLRADVPGTVWLWHTGNTASSIATCAVTTEWRLCQSPATTAVGGPNSLRFGCDARQGPMSGGCAAATVYAWNASLTRSDQDGDTFAMTGTVPVATNPPSHPRGFGVGRRFVGPFTDANYFTGPTLALTNRTMCVAFRPDVLGGAPILATIGGSGGDFFQLSSAGALSNSGVVTTPNVAPAGALSVGCTGRSGTLSFAKLNGGITASAVGGNNANGAIRIGRALGTTSFFPGGIAEVWVTTTAWDESRIAAIQAQALTNGGSGALFPDDDNTVLHVVGDAYDGTTWLTPFGGFTTVGSVSYSDAWVPRASGLNAGGYGPFATTNYMTLGSGNDALDFAGDFTLCFGAMYAGGSGNEIISNATTALDAGWRVHFRATDLLFDTLAAGPSSTRTTTANPPVRGLNVGCVGRAGTSQLAKLNLGATVTTAGAKNTPATSAQALLGVLAGLTLPSAGAILEVWASNDTPSDALFTALQRRALQQVLADGQVVGFSRTTTESYELPQAGGGVAVHTAPAGVFVTAPDGVQITHTSINYALQSEAIDQVPWSAGGSPTLTSNAYVAPDGQTTMDKIAGTATSDRYGQTITVPSSTGPFVASAWVRSDTGTADESIVLGVGGVPSACVCGRSDGGTCSTSIVGTNCVATANVGTVPVRLWLRATPPAAITSVGFYLAPGQFGTSTSTGGYWGAQMEVTTSLPQFPTPYIPTTTATVQRNLDVLTVANPITAGDTRWCVGGTYTPMYRPWNGATVAFLGTGVGGSNNFWATMLSTGRIRAQMSDATTAIKTWDATGTAGWGSTPHRLDFCYNAAANDMQIYFDGVAQALTVSGTNAASAMHTPALFYPAGTNISQLDGWVRDFYICKGSPVQCGVGL